MKVLINGTEREFEEGAKVDYTDIVVSAGYDPMRVVTVMYARGDTCGNLTFGQAISAREGLKITATPTDNA